MNPFIKTVDLSYKYEDAESYESPVLNDLSVEIKILSGFFKCASLEVNIVFSAVCFYRNNQ